MAKYQIGDRVKVMVNSASDFDREGFVFELHPFEVYEVQLTDATKSGIPTGYHIRVDEDSMQLIEEDLQRS